MNCVGIAMGGERRLRKAIEDEVRRKYQKELSAAEGYLAEAALEIEIQKEIARRIRQASSPYSLWSSLRLQS